MNKTCRALLKKETNWLVDCTQLNVKTVLFQTIQVIISTQFSSVWPIGRTLSGATTLDHVHLGVMAMKRYSAIPQTPALLEPHNQICLVSYPEHPLGESYLSAEMRSVYSAAPVDWALLKEGQIHKGCSFMDS